MVATPSAKGCHKEPKVYTVPKKNKDGACSMRDGASRVYFTLTKESKKVRKQESKKTGKQESKNARMQERIEGNG